MTMHVVQQVTYRNGWHAGDPAPVLCRCGWSGDLSELAAHQRHPGAPVDVTRPAKALRLGEYGGMCTKGHQQVIGNGAGRYTCRECEARRKADRRERSGATA